jgi:hypothetical protein
MQLIAFQTTGLIVFWLVSGVISLGNIFAAYAVYNFCVFFHASNVSSIVTAAFIASNMQNSIIWELSFLCKIGFSHVEVKVIVEKSLLLKYTELIIMQYYVKFH